MGQAVWIYHNIQWHWSGASERHHPAPHPTLNYFPPISAVPWNTPRAHYAPFKQMKTSFPTRLAVGIARMIKGVYKTTRQTSPGRPLAEKLEFPTKGRDIRCTNTDLLQRTDTERMISAMKLTMWHDEKMGPKEADVQNGHPWPLATKQISTHTRDSRLPSWIWATEVLTEIWSVYGTVFALNIIPMKKEVRVRICGNRSKTGSYWKVHYYG